MEKWKESKSLAFCHTPGNSVKSELNKRKLSFIPVYPVGVLLS